MKFLHEIKTQISSIACLDYSVNQMDIYKRSYIYNIWEINKDFARVYKYLVRNVNNDILFALIMPLTRRNASPKIYFLFVFIPIFPYKDIL